MGVAVAARVMGVLDMRSPFAQARRLGEDGAP